MRIVGRLAALQHRRARAGERRLADDVPRWSLRANAAWLADGTARGEPFLQVSPCTAGTVLAWELARLARRGYVRIGPLWLPRPWLVDGANYRRIVIDVFQRLLAHDAAQPASAAEFAPKAAHELGPLLALWPHVLAVPTTTRLSQADLIRLRAWPVHPLGVVAGPRWADGGVRSPLEFFCHDLDHARFKVREDLLARGVTVPDAYVDGSTFDPARGRHRAFLAAAAAHVDGGLWTMAPARAALADALLAGSAVLDRALAVAVRWLLFELVHEKSLPLVPDVLLGALADDAHVQKLATKCCRGFYGDAAPHPAIAGRLDGARAWLVARLEQRR